MNRLWKLASQFQGYVQFILPIYINKDTYLQKSNKIAYLPKPTLQFYFPKK